MSKIKIVMKGVGVEIVLGNYMPTDMTILNNWEEFFHYNDLIHTSQLLNDHLQEVSVFVDETPLMNLNLHKIPVIREKSFSPVLSQNSLYLRTECAENAIFQCDFEIENFKPELLKIQIQDYDGLFKTGQSFITSFIYDDIKLIPRWSSADPIGNICIICRHENGFLIPEYDCIRKIRH